MLGSKAPNNDANGLFRATHSHNPTRYSHIMVLTPHFYATLPVIHLLSLLDSKCIDSRSTNMFHYYMFNKPFGCVTARRDTLYPTVMDYFSELHNDHLNPVGRLDRETTGLLLITDDGNWNQQLTHPAYHKKKTYLFTVLGDLTEDRRQFLENGILLKGSPVPTSPAKITLFKKDTLANILDTLHPEVQNAVRTNLPSHPVTYGEITISEGRKRQIRRMMKAVHCCVIELKRISIDDIYLDESLAPGKWKEIFPFEKISPV